jgi:hypothetical protein
MAMTARTRYVFLGAGGVLAAGLVGGLVAYLEGGLPAAAAQSRPEQFRYVPADAHLVAFANVRAVMASDLRGRLQERHPNGGEPEFESRTGIRVGRDIDEVVASLAPNASSEPELLVLLIGRFDRQRLEALAVEQGGTVAEYAGHTLVSTIVGESRLAMAFVEPGVLAVGSEALVVEAIDLVSGGDNVTSNDRLMTLLSTVDPGSNAWAVGELDRPDAGSWMPDGLDTRALRVTAFSAAGRVNGGVRLSVRAETPDEAASQNLRDILQGFLALARMQVDTQPELADVLDSAQLHAVPGEHFVSLSMTLPSATVEWLWDRALAGSSGSGPVAPELPSPPAAPQDGAPDPGGAAPPG